MGASGYCVGASCCATLEVCQLCSVFLSQATLSQLHMLYYSLGICVLR